MSRVKISVIKDKAVAALQELAATQLVQASSLTRVLRMVGHDDRQENDVDVLHPFAILTAFRSDVPSEVNERRLHQMEDLLKRAGIKTYRLTGNWLEPPEGMTFDEAEIAQKLVHIKEDSVFCVPDENLDMDFKAFEAVVTRQADRYEQEAIIMSDGATVWLRFKDGHLKSLGDHIQVDVLEHAYKAMRNQKEHPFVFAAAVIEDEVTEAGLVHAASLSRLLRMIGNPKQEEGKIVIDKMMPFAVLTAWKVFDPQDETKKLTEKDNWARNRKLLNELNAHKMGAYKLNGYWADTPPGLDYEDAKKEGKLLPASREESFLVVKPKSIELADFEQLIKQLAFDLSDQTAYLICDGKDVYQVLQNGERQKLGSKLTAPLIQQAYSRMRGYPDVPFVFAGTITPTDMGMMRWFSGMGLYWVQTPTAEQERMMARLRDLVVSAMKFKDFKSHGGTSKMWIDPKNRPIPLDGMHYEWLRDNAAFIRKAFNMPDMPDFGVHDENPARLWALQHGFTRVNYNPRNGNVTFDTCEKFWTPKRQDVVSMIIADNADDIYSITVNVYSDDGKQLVKDGSEDVRGLDDAAAKVEAIPFVEAARVKIIAECLRRFA